MQLYTNLLHYPLLTHNILQYMISPWKFIQDPKITECVLQIQLQNTHNPTLHRTTYHGNFSTKTINQIHSLFFTKPLPIIDFAKQHIIHKTTVYN